MSDDRVAQKKFAVITLEKLGKRQLILRKIMFSDKAIFHDQGKGKETECMHLGIRTLSCYSRAH
jgi:hypothetical protein